jgi:hypothetical protein
MFSSKYYANPFADDDNDLCYGEILSDQDDPTLTTITTTNSNNGATSSHAEWREKRLGVHSVGSPATQSRRNEPEPASAEIPPSAVRSGEDGVGLAGAASASAADRGRVDTRDYEEYIAELRAELEGANAENNRLTAAQTKAEARARSLLFDKENAEWQLQQEKERSHALAEKVAALEQELEQMASRTGEAANRGDAPHRNHVDPHDPSLTRTPRASRSGGDGAIKDPVSTPMPERQRSMRARAQLQQRQAAYLESRGGSFDRGDAAGAPAPPAPLPDATKVAEQLTASSNSGLTRSLRGQRRAEAVQEKILQQQRLADEQAAEVKELEELLQIHCQRRDELATQLQRLESMRLRTVAEKRKKAAVEVRLEEEEKTIGHIRLELRSHSALVR